MTTLADLERVEREIRVPTHAILSDDLLLWADTIAAFVREQREWQPIETAKQRPVDGQHLFYWFDPGRGWHVGVYYAEDGGTFHGRSGFCDHHDATHWMPLPPPPTATSAKESSDG